MRSVNRSDQKAIRTMAAFLVIFASSAVVAQPNFEQPPITRIVKIQETIDILATAATRRHPISKQELESGVAKLLELSKFDKGVVLEQLLLYHGEKRLKDHGMASDLGVGAIVTAIGYEDSEILSILYPVLIKSDFYWSNRIAKCFLNGIGVTGDPDHPDFTVYEKFIQERHLSPEEELYPLYRYMFGRSPGQAIRSMAKIFGKIENIDMVIDTLEARFGAGYVRRENLTTQSDLDTMQSLRMLADNQTWWIRLYASSILQRQPDFAVHDITSKLESDPNPLVAEFGNRAALQVEKGFTR